MKMDDAQKYKGLLQTWIVAYEKAIVAKNFRFSKGVIDKACCDAVENWTQYLYDNNVIPEIKGKEINTIAGCIDHHIDNLIKGGMWKEAKPTITPTDDGENVLMVEIPDCDYRKGCEWGKSQEHFSLEKGEFRCQRLGCFVGAVKKYMAEEKISEEGRENLDYLMITVHQEGDASYKYFS
jgi:hypothetical protein